MLCLSSCNTRLSEFGLNTSTEVVIHVRVLSRISLNEAEGCAKYNSGSTNERLI